MPKKKEADVKYQYHTLPEKGSPPLYYPTANLDAEYHFTLSGDEVVKTFVPAKDIHAQLKAAENGYRDEYRKLYNSKSGRTTLDASNIVTSALTFIYADTPLEEGSLGDDVSYSHVPVRVPITTPYYTFNTVDFFKEEKSYAVSTTTSNKALRNHTFNQHIKDRMALFNQYKIQTTTALTSPKNFYLDVNKGNFHELFHHSEQGWMEFLSSDMGTTFMAESVQDLGAETLLGVVPELYSTRYVCQNCNVGLIGFQNTHGKGAIHDFTTKLNGEDFRIDTPEEGILWSARVSATDSGKGTKSGIVPYKNDKNTHYITPKDRHLVLQADSEALKLDEEIKAKKYSLDTFSGDFFTSRVINKVNMEKQLGKRGCFQH